MKIYSTFRIAIMAAVCLMPFSAAVAQNTALSMAVDGRSWTYHHRIPTHEDVNRVETYRYYIDGDTVVSSRGITAKKLYSERCPMHAKADTYYVGGIYEDGQKVYIVPLRENPWLLYDFGASPGDHLYTWMGGSLWVQAVDTIEVGGKPLRRLTLSESSIGGEATVCWVEGIGSSSDLVWNGDCWPRFYNYALETCNDGEETVFTFADFLLPEYSIDETDTDRCPYQPMLKEGKLWNYTIDRVVDRTDETVFNCVFTLRGDTVVNGEKAWKMYVSTDGGAPVYHSAWIEEGQKVYRILAGGITKTLMFDFTLKRNAEWFYVTSLFYLHHADEYVVNDVPRNRFTFNNADGTESFSWVEGIGRPGSGIFADNLLTDFHFLKPEECRSLRMNVKLDSCTEDGKQIFPQSSEADAIGSFPTAEDSTTPPIYDLQGRRVQGNKVTKSQGNEQLPCGVYIRDGKKFVVK